MDDKPSDTDEARFNETLKRMLETPPTPHDKAAKDETALTAKKPAKSAKSV